MTPNRPSLSMPPGAKATFESIFNDRKCALIRYLLEPRMVPSRPRSCAQITKDLIEAGYIEQFSDIKPLLSMLKQMGVIELVDNSEPHKGILKKDVIKTTTAGRAYLRKLPQQPVVKRTPTTLERRLGGSINHRFPHIPKPRISLKKSIGD